LKPIPKTEHPLVLRTDFTDQAAWESISATILEPVGRPDFLADVNFLDDADFDGIAKDELLKSSRRYSRSHSFLIIVDREAVAHPEHPLLIVDLHEESGREFRAIPSTIQVIQNNLSLANMNFEEFSESVDKDGIFRDSGRKRTGR